VIFSHTHQPQPTTRAGSTDITFQPSPMPTPSLDDAERIEAEVGE